MATIESEAETLGIKHKKLNKQVLDAITNEKTLDEKAFVEDKQDVTNLLKIDIACHNKDIEYILSVIKSEDMLYVSRAIKQSSWLVDDQYAHIVNPEYLKENVYPYMTAKASIKLHKHIRRYLKAENRVEQFYKDETKVKAAAKWLSYCSIPFIEENIGRHMYHIKDLEFKRLCEKSVTIFEAGMKDNLDRKKLQAASFLLHTNADRYLDIFDKLHRYSRPTFSPSATEIIMKQTPDRIFSTFLKYSDHIHIPTFSKYIKREDVKDFLYNLANKEVKEEDECYYRSVFNFQTIKIFVERMPKEEQFEFVKNIFMDKKISEIEEDSLERGTEMFAIRKIYNFVWSGLPIYNWYEFAPFNIAFAEIKKLIQSETKTNEKYFMFDVLIKCARYNKQDLNLNLLSVLKYYFKTCLYDGIGQKKQFTNTLLSIGEIFKTNSETWNEFMDIIKNMNIYTVTTLHILQNYDNGTYIENFILHYILQNKEIPENILQNLNTFSLTKYRNKLNQDDQNRVFNYMLNYVTKKVESYDIQNENEFNECTVAVQQLLDLLFGWGKQLENYPVAVNKIKDLVRIRKSNSWKSNLSPLYNKKKSWRRLMFEESMLMNPSQDVCVNALKHDPGLLVRYKEEVETLCCDDSISLTKLLKKIRIYWPESIADSWAKSYLERLDKLGGQKALARGLSTLLQQGQLLDVIKKYAPAEPKIDWNKTNELILGLQRSFAKNMHIARPLLPPDYILLYAKGDFLQYALPSLHAIYYNMGRIQSAEHIPKLLDAPVSLQKHGLRFAFVKLKHEELKYHLTNVWQTSKNISIRAVTFVLLFDLLCTEKDAARVDELWEILEVFMDNLSFKEDKKIYMKLSLVEQVPDKIKHKFLTKSYKFLKSLLPHLKNDRESYEYSIKHLAAYTREVMEAICPDFVADIIMEYLDESFFNSEVHRSHDMMPVLSSYLLCARDEETQTIKYEKVLVPLIKRAFDKWNETDKDKYFIRNNFQELLTRFALDLNEYVITNKMLIPFKMFSNIQQELNVLSIPQNYIMLTMWKLIVKKTEIIQKMDKREDWLQITSDMISEYGQYCLDVLKEDVKSYFSCIYVLYEKVLNMTIKQLLPEDVYIRMYEVILSDKDFIPAFLVVLRILSQVNYLVYSHNTDSQKEDEIRKIIREHPSVEVKMHYHCTFTNEDENDILGL